MTDKQWAHVSAIIDLIRMFAEDDRSGRKLPFDQRMEMLANCHEDFDRPDMAAERRVEATGDLAAIGQVHDYYDEIWAGRYKTEMPDVLRGSARA